MALINQKNAELGGPGPSHQAFMLSGGGSGTSVPDWEIILNPPDTSVEGDQWTRGVRYGSRIYKSEADVAGGGPTTDGSSTVTGTLTADPADPGDDGFADTRNGDKIWLHIEESVNATTGLVTADAFEIHSDAQDNDWAGGPFEYDTTEGDDPQNQISIVRVLLGTVITDPADSGSLIVRRNVFGPLCLVGRLVEAKDSSGANPVFLPALVAKAL